MAKVKKELSFIQIMDKIKKTGLKESSFLYSPNNKEIDELESLEERVKKIFRIIDNKSNINDMLFFIMYDIQSNKVRTQIVKYLIKKGCYRIQKSIFLANLDHNTFDTIKKDLALVQEVYDNNDSILIIPISTDYLYAMKVIGQSLDIDLITRNKNTIFF